MKYCDEQIVAEFCIDLHARVDKIPQADISFDHDQCSCFLRRKRRYSQHDLVINAAAKLPALAL